MRRAAHSHTQSSSFAKRRQIVSEDDREQGLLRETQSFDSGNSLISKKEELSNREEVSVPQIIPRLLLQDIFSHLSPKVLRVLELSYKAAQWRGT